MIGLYSDVASETMTTAAGALQTTAWVNFLTMFGPYIMIILILYLPRIVTFIKEGSVKTLLAQMKKMTGRSIIVMSHVDSGLFGQMITMADLMKMERLIRKHKMQDIDFILNTPGGEVFASMRIAELVKRHNGRIIVPKYAMSGGTFCSLGAKEIIMDKNACMGPVDVQIGTLFHGYSNKGWNEIVRKKGYKKAADETVAMAMMGNQVTDTMRMSINGLMNIKNKKLKQRTLDRLTKGETAHLHQFSIEDMKKMGFNVTELKSDLPHKIIERFRSGGVIGL